MKKIVTFETAVALKKAGYPQFGIMERYYTSNIVEYTKIEEDYYDEKVVEGTYEIPKEYIGKLKSEYSWPAIGYPHYDDAAAPTYIDVWLWLWKEKNIKIFLHTWDKPSSLGCKIICPDNSVYTSYSHKNDDVEVAIADAVDLLVEYSKI